MQKFEPLGRKMLVFPLQEENYKKLNEKSQKSRKNKRKKKT